MNKNLLLVILAVSLIPALLSFGREFTGMAISDTSAVAQPAVQSPHPFLSGLVLLYVVITIVVLAVATSYLITLYGTKPTNITPHKHLSKSIENIHTSFKSPFRGLKFAKKLSFKDMSEDRAAQYIVGIVALVGLVAILIMIL